MTPYDSFPYFAFLLYPLALALLLALLRLLGVRAILLISVAILLVQYLNPLGSAAAQSAGRQQLLFLTAYTAGSVVLILVYTAVRKRGKRQVFFYAAVALALVPLLAVKLYPLLAAHQWLVHASSSAAAGAGTINGLLPAAGLFDAFGFLGISYMTFRVIDTIITIHDDILPEPPSVRSVLTYLLFFPTISAGPIDRYRRFVANLKQLPPGRGAYLADLEAGILRIAQGFLYKFIVADLLYHHALLPAAAMPGLGGMLRYMYAYSFYLFFDFAGYSAFAIGTARCFGIRVPENFNAPFLSRDVREMWSRWNMTLSFWLRDHVYMRFLLLATRRRWFGGDRHRANHAALLLTFGLMGCWHGLTPHYIVYGFYQGGMMVLYDVVGRANRRRRLVPIGWRTDLLGMALTFNLFCFGLLIFSGRLFQ
jgi:membrane protein involved in D-alanine export